MSSPSLPQDEGRPSHSPRFSTRPRTGALNSLDELIAEVARLQQVIVEDLRRQHEYLTRELSRVDDELAELTGAPAAEEPVPTAALVSSEKRNVTLSELIAALQAAPDKTLNIRKANLEGKGVKALAKAHPHLLKIGGKGAWPTVTLRERAAEAPPSAKTPGTHPDLFAFRDTTADGSE